ncbi:HAD-like protein [Dissoconium aciculare CBS 342.82]|uniref:HAD-like protein n=1 Tax=Dissoconium aciculare CBS 342.82 TaxID=1314786 RepID=A0A6J3LZ75_9PEZI|nr:HAD-like protein [Dissoconium aciculare CBS 342.82]KAF1819937.1 HAD-like protein [Dissoconium aciculare CBS 342.82]
MALPRIRACLFDMDGLLINSEDLISKSINEILAKYGKPPLPWSVKTQLQGRALPDASKILRAWADLPITDAEYQAQLKVQHATWFPTCAPLPGVEQLLATLTAASNMELALATSSSREKFELKTKHLQTLFAAFPPERRVLGDDPRVSAHKPAPEIYLVALKCINDSLERQGKAAIRPEECLVLEDAILGVEAGRAAGMQVLWCPHPGLLEEIREGGRGEEILSSDHREWVRLVDTLEEFDYTSYGIEVESRE